jgi:hypothetical protein
MKVYILDIGEQAKPRINPFMPHSRGFNIEVGFLDYLKKNPDLLTSNPKLANYHYLPIYWSHWQLANSYGRDNREEMQKKLSGVIIDDTKTFTVSEADNEPGFEIGNTVVFSGNNILGFQGHKWIAAPIITLPHRMPTVLPDKIYKSNFVGSSNTHPIRKEIFNKFILDKAVKLIENSKGEDIFIDTILQSYSTLCPRGSAMGSYRFYESMQLGVAPIMIAEIDFRPFKKFFRWDDFSYYVSNVTAAQELIMSTSEYELSTKGKLAAEEWKRLFEKWPVYILDLLKYEIN